MTSKEEELIKILQSKQEALQELSEEIENLESITARVIKEFPEEIEESEVEALEHFLESKYPYAYGQYKKDGKVLCPVCKKEFSDFQVFVTHWETKHLDEYGKYKPEKIPEEKMSQEETPKEEPKKEEPKTELTPEQALKLWVEKKKTKRRRD
jgi:hypothetical protein